MYSFSCICSRYTLAHACSAFGLACASAMRRLCSANQHLSKASAAPLQSPSLMLRWTGSMLMITHLRW